MDATRNLFRPTNTHVNALEPGAAETIAAPLLRGPRDQAQFRASPAGAIAETLTGRERDILHLIAQGRVDKEIARTLSISPATVKSHVGSIFTKLNVQKRAHAVSRAQRLGLIDTPRPAEFSLNRQSLAHPGASACS